MADALTVLGNMAHRGARGDQTNSGDGADLLVQIPHAFWPHRHAGLETGLPPPSDYGVGMLFLPVTPGGARRCRDRRLPLSLPSRVRVIGLAGCARTTAPWGHNSPR